MKPPIKTMRLYEELKSDMTSNRLRPGVRLPRETELAAKRGVSRVTVRAALAKLEKDQLITRVCGHGTYVRAVPQTDITMLVPCADLMFQTRLSGILCSHLVSGVMTACCACMRKMLLMLCPMVVRKTPFDENFLKN